MSAYQGFSTRSTAQHEPDPTRDDQVQNSAGGYVFEVDKWAKLQRFLILGSEGGTYYVGEKELTRENALGILACINENGRRAVGKIVAVSVDGLAPKNDSAIFALALAISHGDLETRRAAAKALPRVCRTGTHLFQFCEIVQKHRGWGRLLREAVAAWYVDKDADDLAYQLVKYQQRNGWTHRDVMRKTHPTAPDRKHALLYAGVTGNEPRSKPGSLSGYVQRDFATWQADDFPQVWKGFLEFKKWPGCSPSFAAKLIREYNLPREVVPTEFLDSKEVWEALAEKMPMTALIRNLATLTRHGIIAPFNGGMTQQLLERIVDAEQLRKARIHPVAILLALKTYASGTGYRGTNSWVPVQQVLDALDEAFHQSFKHIEPAGKNTLIGLDVSGSMMGYGAEIAGTNLKAGEAAAAMCMAVVRSEPWAAVYAFGGDRMYHSNNIFQPLDISQRSRLSDVLRVTSGLNFGSTDCALPMLHAIEHKLPIDTFIIYTDNETWSGGIHPHQALKQYREQSGRNARLIVNAMTSTGFTIADPNDPGQLDVVGFDASAPQVISAFSRGDV